jgi:hypothetical protein
MFCIVRVFASLLSIGFLADFDLWMYMVNSKASCRIGLKKNEWVRDITKNLHGVQTTLYQNSGYEDLKLTTVLFSGEQENTHF